METCNKCYGEGKVKSNGWIPSLKFDLPKWFNAMAELFGLSFVIGIGSVLCARLACVIIGVEYRMEVGVMAFWMSISAVFIIRFFWWIKDNA